MSTQTRTYDRRHYSPSSTVTISDSFKSWLTALIMGASIITNIILLFEYRDAKVETRVSLQHVIELEARLTSLERSYGK